MNNQLEILKGSTQAFIVLLNSPVRNTLTHRFQVYVNFKNIIMPLAPQDNEHNLKYQVNFPAGRDFPTCHFVLKSIKTHPSELLKNSLISVNPKIKVYFLNGF